MRSYKKEFEEWCINQNIKVYNKLSDVTNKYDFELERGQKCTFINDYGVKFEDRIIMGFSERNNNMFTGEDTGRYVYLDDDAYWFPSKPESIILDKSAENAGLYSFSKSRTLITNISSKSGQEQYDNLRILDKSTGKAEPFHTGNIDLSKESPETIKKILSGAKTSTNSGLIQLSKSATGWGLTIVKQAFSTADASAEI